MGQGTTKPGRRRHRHRLAMLAHNMAHQRAGLLRARQALANCVSVTEARRQVERLIGEVEVQVDALASGLVGNA